MQSQRLRRVNDLLHRVLASAIEEKVRDPRLGFVTVTGVETSPDLRHARVLVSVLGSPAEARTSLEVLNRARGFLRQEIRHEVDLRVLPELQFVFDPTLEYADRINRLLHEVVPPETARPEGEGAPPEAAEGAPADDETARGTDDAARGRGRDEDDEESET